MLMTFKRIRIFYLLASIYYKMYNLDSFSDTDHHFILIEYQSESNLNMFV